MKTTPFEKDLQAYVDKTKQFPRVSTGEGNIPYPLYALAVKIYQVSLRAKGLHSRNLEKLSDLNWYFGTTARSYKELAPKLREIRDTYNGLFQAVNMVSNEPNNEEE